MRPRDCIWGWLWGRLAAGLLPALIAVPALAQPSPAIQAHLRQQNKGCALVGFQELFRGAMQGADRPVTIAAYTIEGCNGGNNYRRVLGVFAETNGQVTQFRAPNPPVEGPAIDNPGAFKAMGDRFSVEVLTYGPNDPRCCPSQKRTMAYRLQNGAVVPAR